MTTPPTPVRHTVDERKLALKLLQRWSRPVPYRMYDDPLTRVLRRQTRVLLDMFWMQENMVSWGIDCPVCAEQLDLEHADYERSADPVDPVDPTDPVESEPSALRAGLTGYIRGLEGGLPSRPVPPWDSMARGIISDLRYLLERTVDVDPLSHRDRLWLEHRDVIARFLRDTAVSNVVPAYRRSRAERLVAVADPPVELSE